MCRYTERRESDGRKTFAKEVVGYYPRANRNVNNEKYDSEITKHRTRTLLGGFLLCN